MFEEGEVQRDIKSTNNFYQGKTSNSLAQWRRFSFEWPLLMALETIVSSCTEKSTRKLRKLSSLLEIQ